MGCETVSSLVLLKNMFPGNTSVCIRIMIQMYTYKVLPHFSIMFAFFLSKNMFSYMQLFYRGQWVDVQKSCLWSMQSSYQEIGVSSRLLLLLYQPWIGKNLLPIVYLTMKPFLNSSSEPNTRLYFNKKCVFTHVYIYCRNAHTALRATHILLYTGCICICNQSQCKCGKGKNPLSSSELVAFSISRITWRLSWSLIQLRTVVLHFLEICAM